MINIAKSSYLCSPAFLLLFLFFVGVCLMEQLLLLQLLQTHARGN